MNSRTVLITGAARRIGAALARAMHADGMNVVVHCHRSKADAETLVADLNGQRGASAACIQADLLRSASCTQLVEFAVARFGAIDALINNASAFFPTPIAQTTEQEWETLVSLNMKAPFFLSRAAAPLLRERSGCIVNVADIHGFRPLKAHPVYSAAKAGLLMLTRALAKELGPEIRVNAVAPGPVLFPDGLDEELKERIIGQTMLKRQGSPQDVVEAIRYLLNHADYVTGQVLVVDGGRTLHS